MTAPVRPGDPIIVNVPLGERGYDIAIGRGLIADLGRRIAALRPGAAVAIVSDEIVAARYLAQAEAALNGAGVRTSRVVVPAGEASKSWRVLESVCEQLLAARIERGDLLVALGGGVVGDLAGFAAAIVRRGLSVVQVPTTLLAQVDSSVGGKTGINSAHGKNQIGAFHQPVLVVADTALLDTLPAREFRAGYAEVVKYGLIGDAGFFAWLDANWRDVLAGGPAREHAIATSCRAKAITVANDERESGERALLNLGHTFGHALEAAAGFSERLLHGEAVAIGMALAEGKKITTIEGLGTIDKPHPVQKAFIDEQAAQCGYCINGMVMTATALLQRKPTAGDAEVRAALAGNLCRCGTHARILRAVARAGQEMSQ